MVRCPHCQRATIPTWRKFWPSTEGAFECPDCGRSVGISGWVYGITVVLLLVILIATGFAGTAGTKWGIIGGAVLAGVVFARLAPFVRR